MKKMVKNMGLTFPVVSDMARRITKLYDVYRPERRISKPATFIIDRQGITRYVHIGKNRKDLAPVSEILDTLRQMN